VNDKPHRDMPYAIHTLGKNVSIIEKAIIGPPSLAFVQFPIIYNARENLTINMMGQE
jgi:hypothetical protein